MTHQTSRSASDSQHLASQRMICSCTSHRATVIYHVHTDLRLPTLYQPFVSLPSLSHISHTTTSPCTPPRTWPRSHSTLAHRARPRYQRLFRWRRPSRATIGLPMKPGRAFAAVRQTPTRSLCFPLFILRRTSLTSLHTLLSPLLLIPLVCLTQAWRSPRTSTRPR